MAKTKLSALVNQIQGKVGHLVFKHYGDKVVVTQAPDFSKVKPTEAQRAHRRRFTEAVSFVHRMLADPAAKAVYEARAKKEHRVHSGSASAISFRCL